MKKTEHFYAGLAPLYHLVYRYWEGSLQRQGRDLDSLGGWSPGFRLRHRRPSGTG